MKKLQAFGISLILFIIFTWVIALLVTKIVIPAKLEIGKSIITPNVVELQLPDAKQLLIEAGFSLEDSLAIEWIATPNSPDLTVLSQAPKAGKIVKNANRIKLEVSTGGKQVVIPLVLGENAINASSKIKQMGLNVVFVKKNYGLYEQNTAVNVVPKVGSKVMKGSKVTIYVESVGTGSYSGNDTSYESRSDFNPFKEDSLKVTPKEEESTLEEILNDNY